MKLRLDGSPVSLGELREVWRTPLSVELSEGARLKIDESAAAVRRVIAEGTAVYGVNTGFGQLAQVRIEEDELTHLQENLVRSHAAGVGKDLDDEVVRLVILLKVMGLARGHSGVRLELVDALTALLEHEIYPCIPSQGSVGASGDLAPLAHLSLCAAR